MLNRYLDNLRGRLIARYLQLIREHADVFANQFKRFVDDIPFVLELASLVTFPVSNWNNRSCPVVIANQSL